MKVITSEIVTLVQAALDKPIAYNPVFGRLNLSVPAILFLSQSIYWSRRASRDDGFFYKKQDEFEQELGLSAKVQTRVRKELRLHNFYFERKFGTPPILYYRIDMPLLVQALSEVINEHSGYNNKTSTKNNEAQKAVGSVLTECESTTVKQAAEQNGCKKIVQSAPQKNLKLPTQKITNLESCLNLEQSNAANCSNTTQYSQREKLKSPPNDSPNSDDRSNTVQYSQWEKLKSPPKNAQITNNCSRSNQNTPLNCLNTVQYSQREKLKSPNGRNQIRPMGEIETAHREKTYNEQRLLTETTTEITQNIDPRERDIIFELLTKHAIPKTKYNLTSISNLAHNMVANNYQLAELEKAFTCATQQKGRGQYHLNYVARILQNQHQQTKHNTRHAASPTNDTHRAQANAYQKQAKTNAPVTLSGVAKSLFAKLDEAITTGEAA